MLSKLYASLQESPDKPIVFLGAGSHFCTGADVYDGSVPAFEALDLYSVVINKLKEHPRPILALCRGGALGGGMAFVCLADVVVAEQGAYFGFQEIKRSVVPGVVSVVAGYRMRPEAIKCSMMNGDCLSLHPA
jgi:enoyl-CoA hydratase/carnithine racemase